MKSHTHFFFTLLFLLIEACPAPGQQIFFNRVLPPKGKIFEHVTRIIQDKQGYMWFTTKRGLYRYDGYQMTSFNNNPLDSNSLAIDGLESISIDSAGFFWIATLGAGVERFDPATGIFTHYRNNPRDSGSLNADWVSAILVDHEGVVWVGTGLGLDRFDKQTGKFVHYRNQPNDPTTISSDVVMAIYEDRQGELWIGTGSVWGWDRDRPDIGGLNHLNRKTGTFTRYMHDPNNPHSLITNKVRAMFEDSKGIFWVGTTGDGLHTMDRAKGTFVRHNYDPSNPQKLSRPPIDTNKEAARNEHITFITEDATGAILIGTEHAGFNYYDPKTQRTTHYQRGKDTAGAFTSGDAWWAYTSRDGIIWMSSWEGNLYRINPFQKHIPHYTLPEGKVNAFVEESSDILWIGTDGGGLLRNDRSKGIIKRFINNPNDPASLSDNIVNSITKDMEGNIWIGTNQGLNLLNRDKQTFTRFLHDSKNNNSLIFDHIVTTYTDPASNLWVGTAQGLDYMNRRTGTFTHYRFDMFDSNSAEKNYVLTILQDCWSKLWAGGSGLHQLDRKTAKFKDYLKGKCIYKIFQDTDSILWVGTCSGLYKYNRTTDSFSLFTDPALSAGINDVHNILEDDQKNLWLTVGSGIMRVNAKRDETYIYGVKYGIPAYDINFFSGYKGEKGELFFGNETGYYSFYPEELIRNNTPPQLVITDFRIDDQPVNPGEGSPLHMPLEQTKEIRLSYDQNNFSFNFAGIHYGDPEENVHLFMLEGYNSTWRRAGSDRTAYYFDVPPASYVFRVKAASSDGIWVEKAIKIIITPPWWSTWWFRITVVFCVLAIFYGIIRWRIYQKFRLQLEHAEKEKQHAEKEKQLADLRHKTVELEMQALRAQMNPHFIFNCLSSINGFILKNESEPASDYLTKFSRLIRMVLTNSKKTFITLEDELEMLKLYLDMERLRFQYSFDYNISFKNEIDPETIFIPPLLLQPFAENAIWHGLMHKQGEGHLEISLSLEEKILTCTITDNGIGRIKAAMIKSKSAEKQKSMGLQITADRLALLNRDIDEQTFFDIEDITDDKGNAAGTRVILKMHYRDMTETIA